MTAGWFERLTSREKTGLAVGVALLLVVLLDYAAVSPAVSASRSLDAEARRLRQGLEQDFAVLQRRAAVDEAYAKAGGLATNALSASETLSRMIGQVDQLAQESGVVISRREGRERPGPKRLEFCDEFVVEIGAFECEMESLVRLLHALASSADLLRVDRLRVSAEKQATKVRGAMVISRATTSMRAAD